MSFIGFLCNLLGPRGKPAIRLAISVQVSGDIANPIAEYSLLRSEPLGAVDGTIVTGTGDILFERLMLEEGAETLTEIIFELQGQVICDGQKRDIEYLPLASSAFNVGLADGSCWCTGQFRASLPVQRPLTKLVVLDRNNDGREYTYCLQFRVPSAPGRFGKLDPSIVNRGPA